MFSSLKIKKYILFKLTFHLVISMNINAFLTLIKFQNNDEFET